MSTTTTYAPIPSAIPAPSRSTDVFDFLHAKKSEAKQKDCVRVQENETRDLVAVTVVNPDGRCIRRTVPTANWREKSYRQALISTMRMLVA